MLEAGRRAIRDVELSYDLESFVPLSLAHEEAHNPGYELYAPCVRKVDNPATQEFPQQGMHREHPRAVVR
jgi:hypothetical protein